MVAFSEEVVSVDEQLKKSGFSQILNTMAEDKAKAVRFKSIYPEGDTSGKVEEADKLYGEDYVIKDVNDMQDAFKDKVIMYHPTLTGNSILGLTGLINTISAKTLKKGQYAIGGKYVYYKVTKSQDVDIQFDAGEKATFSSFYVNAAMGVSDNFEVGYVLPIHSFEVIDPDNDNNLYPYNAKESGAGDVSLRGKFSFPFGNENGYAAAGFGIKLPSGNDDKMSPAGATGEPDFEIFGALSSQFGLLNGHMNIMYSFTGNGDNTGPNPFTYNDDKFTFNIGLDYSKSEMVTLMLEINGEDWGAFGDRADLVAGVRAKMGKKMHGLIAFSLGIHNGQYYGYKSKLILGGSYRF
jgi:hypothetical protein